MDNPWRFLNEIFSDLDDTAKKFQMVTSFKIYLTSPSLRCALFQPIKTSDDEIGSMVETTIFAQWIQLTAGNVYYANWEIGRSYGEVDLVGMNIATQKPHWAVEIKWSDRYFSHPVELVSLDIFMQNNNLHEAIVTSKRCYGDKHLTRGRLLFVPSAVDAYIVGKNTFERQDNNFEMW